MILALLRQVDNCRASQQVWPAPVTETHQAPGVPGTREDERSRSSQDYVLGPGDQVEVYVLNVEEIRNQTMAVDPSGYIRLPLAGQVRVSNLTTEQAGAEIARRLEAYVKHPDVSVKITEYRSQPVSVIGAVRNPGVHQVQGRKTLLEMLSLAGGIDNATAGSVLEITRQVEWGMIPLPDAAHDSTGHFSVAKVSITSLLRAETPEQNIAIRPNDVISVPRGESIFVVGQVSKPGSFLLNDGEPVTVLRAVSMAGGLDRMAQPQHARILRRSPAEAARTEIPVNLSKILEGKTGDLPMQAEDILFVPDSVPKRAAMRAVEAAIQLGTGVAVFRRP